jgi:hypothetical protein
MVITTMSSSGSGNALKVQLEARISIKVQSQRRVGACERISVAELEVLGATEARVNYKTTVADVKRAPLPIRIGCGPKNRLTSLT